MVGKYVQPAFAKARDETGSVRTDPGPTRVVGQNFFLTRGPLKPQPLNSACSVNRFHESGITFSQASGIGGLYTQLSNSFSWLELFINFIALSVKNMCSFIKLHRLILISDPIRPF